MTEYCENCIGTGEIFPPKPEGWNGKGSWVIWTDPNLCPDCNGTGWKDKINRDTNLPSTPKLQIEVPQKLVKESTSMSDLDIILQCANRIP